MLLHFCYLLYCLFAVILKLNISTTLTRSCTMGHYVNKIPKKGFHPRNKFRFGYDFVDLANLDETIKKFLLPSPAKAGEFTINFSNADAVKCLNKCLLRWGYGIQYWDFSDDYLCAPVPGRCDYVHHVADLISRESTDRNGSTIRCFDIGVGANCIYPIIGVGEYKWKFTGSEIDEAALQNAQTIIDKNALLHGMVELRHQVDTRKVFHNVIHFNDSFHVSICNPPFHISPEAALAGTERKWRNLKKRAVIPIKSDASLNFGGCSTELYCEGGEVGFIQRIIKESADPFVHKRIGWFTCLVSKESHLGVLESFLERVPTVADTKIVDMELGSKKSRILAWTFKSRKELAEMK